MTDASRCAITERYEALRSAILAHRTSDERRGLALLVRDGVAAWIDAWARCAPAPSSAGAPLRERSAVPLPTAVVSLLATMVLSTLQEHPS